MRIDAKLLLSAVITITIAGCASPSLDPAPFYGTTEDFSLLRSEYEAMKLGIKKLDKSEYSLELCARNSRCEIGPDDEAENKGPFVVFDCGFTPGIDPAGENSPIPESTLDLLTLAKGAYNLESSAMDGKYPPYIWRDSLAKYETDSLLKIQRKRALESRGEMHIHATEMVEYPFGIVLDMWMYRLQNEPKLDAYLAQEGCGAGEFSVRFETVPKATSLRIIPEFLASVCLLEKKSLEGNDCRYWTEVTIGEEVGMSGIHRYEVTWQDGKKTTGAADFDVTNLGDEADDGDEVPTFRIERQVR